MRKGAGGLTVLSLILTVYACVPGKVQDGPLFERLDSAATHVSFDNELANRKGRLSLVDYLYYYNGAGVACGDINNDGLADLFFVSNEHKNKLYLNQGNFQFKDISIGSGIGGFAEWKTGVTMADINGDGLLDIYVCAVGDYLGLEGSNELYINNGDETFTEKAAEYGLDYTGFSTQAAFFDFDHDGDLDLYLLTHAKFLSRSYTHVIADLLPDKLAQDHFFRNDTRKFTDISDASEITKSAKGYGLGISISDINNDGWEDIYVTNDFYENDYCFINNRDGTFRENAKDLFGHFSRFARGCDIADMNNDGYEDMMTVDMHSPEEYIEKTSFQDDPWDTYLYKLSFGYHSQFGRNCLQISNAGVNFSDRALMSGVSATDFSWSALLADYDNDGYKDIFITSGTARRINDLDYLSFAHEDSMRYAPQLSDHQLDLAVKRIPEGKSHNYFYRGARDLIFEDKSREWGMDTPGLSSGALYSDLDNDGDLDIVTNNVNETACIYENRSNLFSKNNYLAVQLKGQEKNPFGIGARIYLKTKDGFQMQRIGLNHGFLSSADPIAHFGLGSNSSADSLVIAWNDGKIQVLTGIAVNRKLLADHADAKVQKVSLSLFPESTPLFNEITSKISVPFIHKENKYSEFYREKLIPFLASTEGPKIAVADVNHDGRDDFYIGGAKHQPGSLFLQQGTGRFEFSTQPAFSKDSVYEDVDAAFLDIDQDKDPDLYVVSGGNEFYGEMDQQFDRIYRNDGNGHFTRDLKALPPMHANKSCVRPQDIDNDGDLDVFVGGRVVGYNYGQIPRSYLLINDGRGNYSDQTVKLAPELEHAGMITDATWTDIDKDGDKDLLLAGDWMPMRLFENSHGSLKEIKNIVDPRSEIKNINGMWQCISADDFDSDGDIDFIAGNLGMNTTLRKNGEESLLRMYSGDLDANKKNDQIIAYNRPDGKFYPAASKADLEMQIPLIGQVFKTNSDFAGKSIEDLFGRMRIKLPEPLVVNQFATSYFENTGKNNFLVKRMPYDVQVSKVFSIFKDDVNGDGHLDILMAGNFWGSSIYQGSYDASHGAVLQGDGTGGFNVVPVRQSGMDLIGEVRDIKSIKTRNGTIYLVARNGTSLQIFSKNKK